MSGGSSDCIIYPITLIFALRCQGCQTAGDRVFSFTVTPCSWLNCAMRITGGKAARRILKVPKGLDVRPTPDLVKQAVFNSLGARVQGARVLELFAGTGSLSLECLSRGAVTAA